VRYRAGNQTARIGCVTTKVTKLTKIELKKPSGDRVPMLCDLLFFVVQPIGVNPVRQHRQPTPMNWKVFIMPTERPACREADRAGLRSQFRHEQPR